MRTIRLRYLQKQLPQKLKFKTLLLTFVASLFLSACGIKGDLYQTPEQPVTETEAVEVDDNKTQTEELNKSLESGKQPSAQQPIEQVSEQPSEQTTEPVIDPALDRVKSPYNVS